MESWCPDCMYLNMWCKVGPQLALSQWVFSKVSFSEFFMVYETGGCERGLHRTVFLEVYEKWYFQKVSFLV